MKAYGNYFNSNTNTTIIIINMLAGSATGALNAPEFIYDKKPTTLQYSRDETRGGGYVQGKGKDDRPKKDYSREPEPPKQPKMDWICENVSYILLLSLTS